MSDNVLTGEQFALANAEGSLFVEACPGAGKTRSLVARFLRVSQSSTRRGTTLLSFTNAAIAEVVGRCPDRSLLGVPNFVGTFDAFINRFITAPNYVDRYGASPRFVDSWDSMPATRVTVAGLPAYLKYDLEWFEWTGANTFTLDCTRVRGKFKSALLATYEQRRNAIDGRAREVLRTWARDRRVLSSSASRHFALTIIRNQNLGPRIGSVLGARFNEIIVDEAQDCGLEEIEILRFARAYGLNVVAVADLDQAIFEFRRAVPEQVRAFGQELGQGKRLSGNYRSTRAICAVTDRLRASDLKDSPVGPDADFPQAVQVVEFSSLEDVADRVRSEIAATGLDIASGIVLAHRRKDALTAAGHKVGDSRASGRKALVVAQANLVLRAESDPTQRKRAIETVETILLELIESEGPRAEGTSSDVAASLGISTPWLRDAAMRVALTVAPTGPRDEYSKRLREVVSSLRWPSSTKLLNLSSQLASPTAAEWETLDTADELQPLRCGTVHSVKGLQFESVALVVPKDLPAESNIGTCLDAWEAGLDTESRRVLYVGASRAQRLLLLLVHEDHGEQVRRLLSA